WFAGRRPSILNPSGEEVIPGVTRTSSAVPSGGKESRQGPGVLARFDRLNIRNRARSQPYARPALKRPYKRIQQEPPDAEASSSLGSLGLRPGAVLRRPG